MKDHFSVSGMSIVVTGGTGVLGSAMMTALAEEGANVASVSRTPSKADALIKQASSSKGRIIAVKGDVLDKASLELAAKQIVSEFGNVDGLINAAGGNHPKATTGKDRSFFQLEEEGLRYVSDLNLLGTVLPSQVFGKLMVDRNEGVILNVTSMSGFRPLTRVGSYSAAKAAIINFTQWLATHVAQEYSPKIRVNAIAPGFFLTEQNRFLLTEQGTGKLTERGKKIIDHTPMGRFGDPQDLVGAVLWLLSPASNFVTGIVVPVDGGFSAYSGV